MRWGWALIWEQHLYGVPTSIWLLIRILLLQSLLHSLRIPTVIELEAIHPLALFVPT